MLLSCVIYLDGEKQSGDRVLAFTIDWFFLALAQNKTKKNEEADIFWRLYYV
jgi:hypothetical protein